MPLPTVLIEDSATIRESLIPAMEEFADVQILAVAETAAEGIAALAKHNGVWRLAVVDVFLREGNGLEVVRAVQRLGSHQRYVIVLTNYATAEIRTRAYAAGADAIFDKSTELEPFLSRCEMISNRYK